MARKKERMTNLFGEQQDFVELHEATLKLNKNRKPQLCGTDNPPVKLSKPSLPKAF